MPNVLSPFAAKVTDSLSGPHQRARLLLTAMYVVILATILFLSSSITYSAFSRQLDHRFARFRAVPAREVTINNTTLRSADVRSDLINALTVVNGLLLLSAGMLSYWLAGLTLRPIQTAFTRQRQFLSDASHELRTPLAVLQIELENELTAAATPSDVRAKAASKLEEVTRMARLVNDLLVLSRMDERAVAPVKSAVPLHEIVEQVITSLKPAAADAGVTLTYTPTVSPCVIFTNRDMAVQALMNIVHNAIAYNNRPGQVTIITETSPRTATITVRDTGVGIAANDLPNIFSRFYRVDKSRSRQTGGSGLGLSIVQTIMQRLGGDVQLSSTPGDGTTAVLTFPVHSTS